MSVVVELRQVAKLHGRQRTLDGIDLTVAKGEIVGLCGPSGCGKSTLLRLIGAVDAPDAGTIAFAGKPVWNGRRRALPADGFVMPVFQHPAASLDARWPLWRSLNEPLWKQRLTSEQRRSAARIALDSADLSDISVEARPHELSGGQCQRVAILRALIAAPAILVADEPTSALDTATAVVIRTLLVDAARKGTAIVIASHDINALQEMSDRILVLENGTVAPRDGMRGVSHPNLRKTA
jgi:peptide/nickel transport system ATP-binding protein